MATESILEQYRIHDFVAWNANKELELNPHFQRRSVWDPQARTLLIDTILRRMPVPKIYMRTKLDTRSKRSIREIVDGQQRLRAILGFANGEFALTRRASEFSGKKYDDLTEEQQERFLSYPLAVDSLVNASDSDVLEVFARLNSYTVTLVAAEKRHAKFQGDFKWAVHNAATDWNVLWETFKIVTGRDRLRMGDDSFMAELYGVVLEGVTDGGASRLDGLYARHEDDFPQEDSIRRRVDDGLAGLLSQFGEVILNTPLCRAPQFLMLFASYIAANTGLDVGQLADDTLVRPTEVDIAAARDRLALLAESLEADEPTTRFVRFVDASRGSTQRIATRSIRYRYYRWALTGEEVIGG